MLDNKTTLLFLLTLISVISTSAAEADQTTTTNVSTNASGGSAPPIQSMQAYYDDIWNRIKKTWWVPEELLFKQVKLHMIIEKDGQLSTVTIAKSSGDSRADTLALIGVKRAAPFAPLPEGLPSPLNTFYTIGFTSNDDKAFLFFDGKRYDKGQSYTLPTGTKVGHGDGKISELDKQFHVKKEAALIKMYQLDQQMAKEDKSKEPTVKKAILLDDYARCLTDIQEPGQAKTKLLEALEIMDKNSASDTELYPCLCQLAELDYSIGDLSAAEPLFKRAIAIKEKEATGTNKDPAYKGLLQSYAKLLYKQNRAGEADIIYKKIKELG